ncbi:MAG: 50S ribosomal protein L7/L12 [Proteobacteria bacterium]|nr:50S ribosomal protein L7/L12 [Pseudomonadota bacterium]
MADINQEQVVEYLSGLTVMELVKLTETLEEKWGVKAAPVAVAGPAGPAPEVEEKEEQTEFTVVLKGHGPQKIQTIKACREITGLGLKDAKDLVDNAPKEVKVNVSKAEAEEIAEKLKGAGAEVEIK